MISSEKLQILQDYLAINDEPQKCDVIFVFGGIRMPKVWERALQLYQSGFASRILVTGGFGPGTVSANLDDPEAETIRNYLIDKGIPAGDIITELEATNTLENILLGIQTLLENGIEPESIIAVSKPFHMRRCLATFQKQFPNIKILCCPPVGSIEELMDRPSEEYAQRLIDEVKRLKKYAEKGDIVEQVIPEEIMGYLAE